MNIFSPRSPVPEWLDESYPSTSQGPSRRNSRCTRSKARTMRAQNFILYSSSSSQSSSDSDSDYGFVKTRSQKRTKRYRLVAKHQAKPAKTSTPKTPAMTLSKTPKKRSKLSSSSTDNNKEPKRRRNLRANARSRALIDTSDDEIESARRNSVENKSVDSPELSACPVRVRTDLMLVDAHTEDSMSSSSSSSDSSSSSSSSSNSGTSLRVEKSRKKRSSRLAISSSSSPLSGEKYKRPKLKSTVVKCRPVTADKKEWYIEKPSSQSSSRSISSYDSQEEHLHHRPSTSGNKLRRVAQKIANERLKDGSFYSTADSQNDEESQRSQSQSSTRSSDKHKSKHKGKRETCVNKQTNSSTLSSTISNSSTYVDKHDENKKNSTKKRSKTHHKKHPKDSKQKHSKSKSKRSDGNNSNAQTTKKTYSLRHNDKRRRCSSYSSATSSVH